VNQTRPSVTAWAVAQESDAALVWGYISPCTASVLAWALAADPLARNICHQCLCRC
jgi:hypothetical protein